MKKHLAIASVLLTSGFSLFATTIAPSFGSFGTLSGATFGGTGIPNTAVAIKEVSFAGNNDTITLGLTATARYSNPTVGNDGAGTFFATPGLNNGLDGGGHTLGPTWNFDYYIKTGANNVGTYSFALLYANNTTGVSTSLLLGPITGTAQDSWNLSMGFLNTIGFDPNASGQYGFELELLNSDSHVVAKTAINVDVGTSRVPDGSSTALLLGLGFAGLAVLGFRQNRQALAK